MSRINHTQCLIAAIAIAGVLRAQPPQPLRVDQWQTVIDHQIADRGFKLGYSKWLREPGNQSKTVADYIKTTRQPQPDATRALQAAINIAKSNPTDDLGCLALRFCIYSGNDPKHAELRKPAFTLLGQHYTKDSRIERLLLFLARSAARDGQRDQIDLLNKVIAANPEGSKLRVLAAFYSSSERLNWVNNLTLTGPARIKIRNELADLAKLVIAEGEDQQVFGRPAVQRGEELLNAIEKLSVGGTLPNVEAHVVGGGKDELKKYQGKVVLIDFWATWCIPCVKSLPDVVRFKKEMSGRPFEVIAISVDRSDDLVQQFLKKKMELPFVHWRSDFQSKLYQQWLIQGVPTYFLIDEKGVIHGRGNNVKSLLPVARKLVTRLEKE